MTPFVSICIPAYKRVDFLSKLLDSIAIQTYRDFEVIITDDSSDDSVAALTDQYKSHFPIHYQKNPLALGTPANWNAAIGLAKGQWIKMMHDDDWFTDKNGLQQFASIAAATKTPFIFSGFYTVNLENGQQQQYVLTRWHAYLLKRNPYNILSQNFIGHPSTTLIRNDQYERYDERVKWVVDIEYYSRCLVRYKTFYAIRQPLISLGISSQQVTKAVFRKPEVEVPENLYLLNKITPEAMKSILVYDYFWRFIRNLGIRSSRQMEQYATSYVMPGILKTMIRHQGIVSISLLRIGIISKTIMLFSYLYCRVTNKFVVNR